MLQQVAEGEIQKASSTTKSLRISPDCFGNILKETLAKYPKVEIEVGSGKGLYLINAAQAQPETGLIGIEIANKYVGLANKKVQSAGLPNITFLCGDAVQLLAQACPSDAIDAVHVYFPDPWWKKRHKKRRVVNETLVTNIQRILKPGGTFHFWTDVLEYFEVSLELIAQVSSLQGPNLVDEKSAEHGMDYRTHFERRTRLNGLPVYRSEFKKAI